MPVHPGQIIDEIDVAIEHLFDTVYGGAPATIGLHKIAAGKVETAPFLTITQFDYDPVSDGAGGLIDRFIIAETKLAVSDALKVAAITYGGKLYSVPDRTPPRGQVRKWFFRSRVTQNV